MANKLTLKSIRQHMSSQTFAKKSEAIEALYELIGQRGVECLSYFYTDPDYKSHIEIDFDDPSTGILSATCYSYDEWTAYSRKYNDFMQTDPTTAEEFAWMEDNPFPSEQMKFPVPLTRSFSDVDRLEDVNLYSSLDIERAIKEHFWSISNSRPMELRDLRAISGMLEECGLSEEEMADIEDMLEQIA